MQRLKLIIAGVWKGFSDDELTTMTLDDIKNMFGRTFRNDTRIITRRDCINNNN